MASSRQRKRRPNRVTRVASGWGLFWLLWAAVGQAGEPRDPGASWDFIVEFPDLERGLAEVTWTVRGFGPARPLRVCADMDEAERFVRTIERVEGVPAAPGARPAATTRKPLPRDGACWRVPGADPRGVVLHYTYDLRGLAAHHGSPDYAQRIGDTYIFNDETLLLRPDPLPRDDGAAEPRIHVELRLPPAARVATPWQRLPGPGQHFALTAAQFDRGSYVTIGNIEELGEIKLPHTTVQLVTLPTTRQLSAAALRGWVSMAMAAVDGFYGALTPPRVLVNLVPIAGSTKSGIFGTVLRPLYPSVVIYFGSDCQGVDKAEEWVAVHELFHIGNPWTYGKISWFIEGFTTYYQDVLRARSGALTSAAAWGDLWDGLRRFCQPDGSSLKEESDSLQSRYHYTRVYWGGACLAFLSDVAIRERSHGKQTLDDVMRELRRRSQSESLDEDDILTALDQAVGSKQVSGWLRERRAALPVRAQLQRLGVEVTGDDTVRLHDDAPLAAVRRAMF